MPKKKDPAYPKPGTGEDFPARKPGTRVAETRSGQKVTQSTRATQRRRAAKAVQPRGSRENPFPAIAPNWPSNTYGGSEPPIEGVRTGRRRKTYRA